MFRVAAAAVGATALAGMVIVSAFSDGTKMQSAAVVPEHFGGPVDTSVYNPAATLSIPTLSTSATSAPSALSAPSS